MVKNGNPGGIFTIVSVIASTVLLQYQLYRPEGALLIFSRGPKYEYEYLKKQMRQAAYYSQYFLKK